MKKTMKGIVWAALAAVVLPVLVSCAGKEKKELYIFNWTYYTPPSVVEKFEQETGAKVIYDEFASNEDMYAKIQAGGAGYDIVFPSGDYVSIMAKQGMLKEIDHSRLANLGNIDPAVLAKAGYDPEMRYSVPYYFGAAGVIVNTEKVPGYEKSWAIFGRADLKGRMTMLDDMREVLGDALAFKGYSVNTADPAQIEEARVLVNEVWKPNLTKFDAEAFGKGYANGEFWVVQGYPEVVFEEIADNADLKSKTVFFIPQEGGPAYIDSMCILKDAKHEDLAYAFIDFIHRPDIYAEFCDSFGFPATVNVPARALKTGESWYQPEDLEKVELKDDLGPALALYNTAWFETIKVGE
ncbi:MAG: extracellular solute-binding protein [Treponema sp.]|jgi:spermidine/putrescine transport system substrate-binding protein|nr:extracellular solute-binding protein [Treponema sp.]